MYPAMGSVVDGQASNVLYFVHFGPSAETFVETFSARRIPPRYYRRSPRLAQQLPNPLAGESMFLAPQPCCIERNVDSCAREYLVHKEGKPARSKAFEKVCLGR